MKLKKEVSNVTYSAIRIIELFCALKLSCDCGNVTTLHPLSHQFFSEAEKSNNISMHVDILILQRRHVACISFSNQSSCENCAVQDYYAANSGKYLPTFRENLSALSSRFKYPKIEPAVPIRRLNREECGR
jgi:hypothetical protein